MAAPLAEVTAILRQVSRNNELDFSAGTRFDDIAGCDSFDLVAVVVEVEFRFNLQFELWEIERLITVGDLLHMIMAKQALASA